MRASLRMLGFALVVAVLVSCAAPPSAVPGTGATTVPQATSAVSPTDAATEVVSPTVAATGVVSPTVAATGVVSPTVAATSGTTSAMPAGATVQIANNTEYGKILVDAKGMTLYLFTNDTPGVSNCSGNCLVAWPPLLVPAGTQPTAGSDFTGKLGTIQRADGTTQVTVNDMPVYYFQNDKAAGDVNGQGLNAKWYVLTPAGVMITK